jgi:hypothetical protein
MFLNLLFYIKQPPPHHFLKGGQVAQAPKIFKGTVCPTTSTQLFKKFNCNWPFWKKLPACNKHAILQKCLLVETQNKNSDI